VRLDAAALVLADSAARWEEADVPQRGLLANRAKWVAAEAGLYVTSKAMQVVGGRATYKELPVERAFRDLRTATLMPPTPDRMLQGIGQMALGIQGGMFKVAGDSPAR
jgi:alkylation response protein AidB-like acyl-CoA dehydrogenase